MSKTIDFRTMGVEDFGVNLYCVRVPKSICKDGDIFIYADNFEITDSGDLVFLTIIKKEEIPMFSFSKGNWSFIYLAHPSFKYPMNVETWKDVAGVGITYKVVEKPVKEVIIEKPVKADEIETEPENQEEQAVEETEPIEPSE